MRVTVALVPSPDLRVTGCAVILDILRASTTLTVALANGAAAVLPIATVEEALRQRAARSGALACGERDGLKCEGFDLGNSPLEYTPGRVQGQTLVFASTNGSRLMLLAARARRRVLGAFVNAAAVVEAIAREPHVTLMCAGKQGRFCLEDAACAGLLCERLAARGARLDGAAARFARTLAPRDADETRRLLEGSAHGRDLRALGPAFARDVVACAALDSIDRAFDA